MVKPNIFNLQIAKEWAGTSGEFIKVLMGPGVGKPAADVTVLTKWMVTAFWCQILTQAVGIGVQVVNPAAGASALVAGITNFITFVIMAFLQTWIIWYGFVKREPSCCFCCIACIEDFQPMHLLYGILLVLNGISQALTALQAIAAALAVITTVYGILYLIFVVFYCLYAVCNICAGICPVQRGGKKAGVDIPGGAPAEMVGA
jgi:hypothetical protein